MKKIFFLLFLSMILQLKAQEDKINSVIKVIADTEHHYAPDKRTAVWEVSANELNGVVTLTGETNIKAAKKHLLENLKTMNVPLKDEIQTLPAKDLGENIYGIVNLSVANIRTEPEDRAELASQSLLGTCVRILKKIPGYYLIQTPDQYIGWMDNDGLVPVNKTAIENWMQSEKVIFTKEFGFVFATPDISENRVSDLAAGDLVSLESEENNFYKVKYPDNRIGFIPKSDCEPFKSWLDKRNPTGDDIISTTKLFLGFPYLWGGTSVKGMDCSGFTKTVYFMNGIVLPRDASQQVHTGVLVDTKSGFGNLQSGDLLFFGFAATDSTKERITHVGIYIGNLKFIHSSGMVKINSFDKNAPDYSDFRTMHFIRAKRILGSLDKNGITTIKKNKFYFGEM
ncbi:MAG: NlpC/P60 family protein [Bacteroidota bacterium]